MIAKRICMGMVMASMLCSVSVSAQKVVNFELDDIFIPAKCWNHLSQNPADTLQAEASFIAESKGVIGGMSVEVGDTLDATFRVWVTNYQKASMHIDSLYHKTGVNGHPILVFDSKELQRVRQLADKAWAAFYAFTAKGNHYDARYLTIEAGGVVFDSIPERWVRKYGILFTAGTQVTWNNSPELSITAGIQFVQKYWMISGEAGRTHQRQNENSQYAGRKDGAWLLQGMGYLKLPLDKYAHWQIGVGGGYNWVHYTTNSRGVDGGIYQSAGDARGLMAGAILNYRPHCSKFNFQLTAGMAERKDVEQNKSERKNWKPYVGLKVAYNLSNIGL